MCSMSYVIIMKNLKKKKGTGSAFLLPHEGFKAPL